jgi:hypothetical protein
MKKTNSLAEEANVKINPRIKVHPNPAPRKMAIAIGILEEYNASQKIKRAQKNAQPQLTTLQKELLNFYAQEPTEAQMQQIKAFLSQLLKEDIHATEMSFESKIAA